MPEQLSLAQVEDLSFRCLIAAGASDLAAQSVARSIRAAERDGIRSHGLMYLPIYMEHLRCGKVLGAAVPLVTQPRRAAVVVDAANGFAHPAIAAGWQALTLAAQSEGVATMTISRSYNCGVLGHHAERLAEAGLIGLCMTHAPASIAPIGWSVPVIGPNPFAMAVPDGKGGVALSIDQSASVVAKSEVMMRARRGEALPEGWALDAQGQPTTSAEDALKGSMMPSGGYKGFGIGLMVEVLASAMAGANSSRTASPFSGPAGGPPGTGQCFIAFDPGAYADGFSERIAELIAAVLAQDGTRLPGSRRRAARAMTAEQGVLVDDALMARLLT